MEDHVICRQLKLIPIFQALNLNQTKKTIFRTGCRPRPHVAHIDQSLVMRLANLGVSVAIVDAAVAYTASMYWATEILHVRIRARCFTLGESLLG